MPPAWSALPGPTGKLRPIGKTVNRLALRSNAGYALTGRPDGLSFGGAALAEFLRSDTDGVVTLFLKRVQPNGFENTSLFTREMGELYAPGLQLVLAPRATPAPLAVDLLAGFDSGLSGTDDVTNANNAGARNAARFAVTGTTPGATVTLYADGVPVGSAVATGTRTEVLTNGLVPLADGLRSFTARQTLFGFGSADSTPLGVFVDATGPAVVAVSGVGAETPAAVGPLTVTFTEALWPGTFTASALSLTRGGVAVPLDGRVTVTALGGNAFRIDGLSWFADALGDYSLTIGQWGLLDAADNQGVGTFVKTWRRV